MIFVGYFEGIGSQRARVRSKAGVALSGQSVAAEASRVRTARESSGAFKPDAHPSASSLDVFEQVFSFVLPLVEERGLLKGKTVGVDSTLLEANAAMKSIVSQDTLEDWEALRVNQKIIIVEGRKRTVVADGQVGVRKQLRKVGKQPGHDTSEVRHVLISVGIVD